MPFPAQADVAEYYTKIQIETASKKKAVYMLHERCIFFLLKAQSGAGQKKILLRQSAKYPLPTPGVA